MKKLTEKQQFIREMPLVLLSFLLKRKLLHVYCTRARNVPLFKCEKPNNLIGGAFLWNRIPEGSKFWYKINKDHEKLFQ